MNLTLGSWDARIGKQLFNELLDGMLSPAGLTFISIQMLSLMVAAVETSTIILKSFSGSTNEKSAMFQIIVSAFIEAGVNAPLAGEMYVTNPWSIASTVPLMPFVQC